MKCSMKCWYLSTSSCPAKIQRVAAIARNGTVALAVPPISTGFRPSNAIRGAVRIESRRTTHTPSSRVKNAAIRLELTAEVLKTKTSAEWLARLDAEQVPCAPVQTREEILRDPQLRENGLIVHGMTLVVYGTHKYIDPCRYCRKNSDTILAGIHVHSPRA